MLGDAAAACELDDFEIGVVDDVFHGLIGAVDEVDVFKGHAAISGEAQELFHDDGHFVVAF